MSYKEIIGFKNKESYNNYDNICPNCNHKAFLPIGVKKTTGFLGWNIETYLEYTCDNCGCVWRVKKEV